MLGFVLDTTWLRRRKRAFAGWTILLVITFIVHIWAYYYQRCAFLAQADLPSLHFPSQLQDIHARLSSGAEDGHLRSTVPRPCVAHDFLRSARRDVACDVFLADRRYEQ